MQTKFRPLCCELLETVDAGRYRDHWQHIIVSRADIGRRVAHHADRCPRTAHLANFSLLQRGRPPSDTHAHRSTHPGRSTRVGLPAPTSTCRSFQDCPWLPPALRPSLADAPAPPAHVAGLLCIAPRAEPPQSPPCLDESQAVDAAMSPPAHLPVAARREESRCRHCHAPSRPPG